VRAGLDVPVLDGGPSTSGVESTILAIDGDAVTQLRAGALPRDEIEAALGRAIDLARPDAAIAAPGMLASHYAPNATLRLDATSVEPGEVLLGFGNAPDAAHNLSPSGDLREAARNLFAMLHELDATATRIAVSPIPQRGLGEAINDRLQRAATVR
jgi:L-threonylcarbamoyladenylate synthase